MTLPDFIMSLPALDVPFDADTVETHAMASDQGLVVWFLIHKDFVLPPHAHKAQWGTVLQGEIELTIADDTRIYYPGDSYSIPSGAVHSGKVKAGSIVVDVFEEPDRYALRG